MEELHKTWIIVGIVISLLALTFLFFSGSVSEVLFGRAVAAGTTHRISIENFAFSPQELIVEVGDTVIWENKDTAPHTVVSSGNGPLDSGSVANAESYSYIFTEVGTYEYFCSLHPFMLPAKIIVRERTTPVVQPDPSPSTPPAPEQPAVEPAMDPEEEADEPEQRLNVTLSSPMNDSVITNNSLLFNYSFTGVARAHCQFYSNFSGRWTMNFTNSSLPAGNRSVSLFLVNGSYLWNVYCVDTENSSNSAWADSNYTFSVRAPVPEEQDMVVNNRTVVTLLQPPHRYNSSNQTVTFRYSFQGPSQGNCSLYGDFNGTWARNFTQEALVNGTHILLLNISEGRFNWNIYCEGYTNSSNYDWGDSNRTLIVSIPLNISRVNNQTNTTACQEAWSCTPWTACANDRQTRTCTDAHSCGTTLQQPPLTQVCVTSTTSGSQSTSTATQQPTQTAPSFPSPTEEVDREPALQEPTATAKKSNAILFTIIGSTLFLLLLVAVLFYFFYWQKRGSGSGSVVPETTPQSDSLKQYVARDRARGVTDTAIRQNLLRTGWNKTDIDEAMKK